nr:UPF0161 protein At3g09310 isoform X1 [Ipomoea batatas]
MISLNCTHFHKPCSPSNPNLNSPLVSPNQIRHFNNLFPNKKIRWAKESRLVIANGAEKDSSHSSSQDEEVNDLGVKTALSMLKFYKKLGIEQEKSRHCCQIAVDTFLRAVSIP